MHKLVVLYPKPADPEHFRDYYVSTHLPLVAQMPGLLAYRYSFDVTGAPGQEPYFAIFEADFADGAAMTAARSSEEGRRVSADVVNYATGGAIVIDYPVRDGVV
ncbi:MULTISPECIES: EthD family reductase [Amycolatopsis]|uniref:EthD family reductase n=1 Tax=Amycolatopsis dendrobii TaxID=2760662 RepID=A0A7W3VU34_9PSEU|nr:MULTISPECIES: EthD family reductase [Amycolatopsis]MBB1153145.1 EthD family reductase [Amycolatopsis dendrobii]UKD53874.1 EthD family reductase [Amycolatopsis sp. FU40]